MDLPNLAGWRLIAGVIIELNEGFFQLATSDFQRLDIVIIYIFIFI